MPEPYTYAANTDTMSGILDTHAADTMNQMPMAMMLMPFPFPVVTVTDAHGTDAHAVDTHAMYGVLFWWYSIPMPCVASSGGDRHLCSRHHEPDTYGHDAH